MLPDRVSNPGPLTYESGVLPIALRGPAIVYPGLRLLPHEIAVSTDTVYPKFRLLPLETAVPKGIVYPELRLSLII